MVLRSMPPPAWLAPDAPENDVVISSRCRFARNIRGHLFPNHASANELKSIAQAVKEAGTAVGLEAFRKLSEAEREYMIGCRLMSPEFKPDEPGRLLLLDERRAISIMVNEEDHLRVQALHAGWSIGTSIAQAKDILRALSSRIEFAETPRWGFLTASPFNTGEGIRLSAMFHLAGLAHTKRLAEVVGALSESDLTARGLFGESSRAVGAFFQVSMTRGNLPRFSGACEYLMQEERLARGNMDRDHLNEIVRDAIRFAVVSKELSQVDALRVIAWTRWGIAAGFVSVPIREIDAILSTLELRNNPDESAAARDRAAALRSRFEHVLTA